MAESTDLGSDHLSSNPSSATFWLSAATCLTVQCLVSPFTKRGEYNATSWDSDDVNDVLRTVPACSRCRMFAVLGIQPTNHSGVPGKHEGVPQWPLL